MGDDCLRFMLRLEAATVAVKVSPTFSCVGFLGRSPTSAAFDISEYCIEGRIWHELTGKVGARVLSEC